MEPGDHHFLATIFDDASFTQQDLDRIVPAFRKVEFGKNDYLLNEGDLARDYWFVEDGIVRSFAVDPAGNDVSTGFFTRGDIVIDWPSFFLHLHTKENIQALTHCTCWQLDFDTFQRLFHDVPSFRDAGRARLVGSYFDLKRYGISMIVDRARDRYMALLRDKPEIVRCVPLKYIASYLGITDTSLSRIRKELADEAGN